MASSRLAFPDLGRLRSAATLSFPVPLPRVLETTAAAPNVPGFSPGGAPHLAPPTPYSPGGTPREWSLDTLCGRFVEMSSAGESVAITAAASLILDAHHRGEPAAWVSAVHSTFFPPDFAQCGIDLASLPVLQLPHALSAARAAEQLLRSGGFGIIVLDLGHAVDMRMSIQTRLAALAKKHRTVLLCLTQKEPAAQSLGPLVSLRVRGTLQRIGFDRFRWELETLRDRRSGTGWRHTEVCHGTDGLC
jgi:recombination protein RecA